MGLYEDLVNGKEKLSLVGLGYVGMPIAVAFARKINVVGFDLNEKKIELYKNGVDPTNEVGNEVIKNTKVAFTRSSYNPIFSSILKHFTPTFIMHPRTAYGSLFPKM